MKKWNEAEIVEINIVETANGRGDDFIESYWTNTDLATGNDSDEDGVNQNETFAGFISGILGYEPPQGGTTKTS